MCGKAVAPRGQDRRGTIFGMKITRQILAATALALAAPLALAHDFQAGGIHIGHPWARPTVAGQKAGGGYLRLDNRGSVADRLVAASAEDVAGRVEMHSMTMEGDVMRMREVERGIALPSGQAVALEPGGYHLMLMDLKAPLKLGSSFPLKLRFEKAGEVMVDVKVETPAAAPAASATPHHH